VYNFNAVVGRTVLSDQRKGVVRGIEQGNIFIHPRWRGPLFKFGTYDVAVLKLQGTPLPATWTIRLASSSSDDVLETPGRPAFLAGWGQYNSAKHTPHQLVQVRIPVVSDDEALKVYPQYYDPPVQVAAGASGRGGCPGDSGGPLFALDNDTATTNIQIGILNYGLSSECNTGHVEVYAEVNSDSGGNPIRDFIKTSMAK
jgi:hypothetical protein